MHSDEVIWHEESGGTTWKTSHRCCIMRKVISKEVATGGRLHFFLDSVFSKRRYRASSEVRKGRLTFQHKADGG